MCVKINAIKMRVVALVSGGKDSSYNMMKCVAEGHDIVALANLHPKDKGLTHSHTFLIQLNAHSFIYLLLKARTKHSAVDKIKCSIIIISVFI